MDHGPNMRGEIMVPYNCPHCGKELAEPLFRFCNHCNGNIQEVRETFKEDAKKRRIEEFTG